MINSLLFAILLGVIPNEHLQLSSPGQLKFDSPNTLKIVIIGLELIPAFFLTVFIHESGHALMAKSRGLEVTRFTAFPTNDCGGSFAFGCVSTSYQGSDVHDRLLIKSGGILATRTFAEGIDILGDQVHQDQTNQFIAILYFTTRLDSVRYILRCTITSLLNKSMVSSLDPQGFAEEITLDREKQKWIHVGMATIIILDLLLDWDEIKKNWNRLWLSNP